MNYKEVVRIIEQTLAALEFAHSQGFVHRDIKEQNILVHGEFPYSIAKLTDFGLSKSFKQTGMSGVTMVGDVAGTIAYMPPEQVRDFKDVKPPSDIYAIGMTAYSLLTGANALDIGPRAGIAETVDQLDLDRGRHDRFFVLQAVAGTDFDDAHAAGQAGRGRTHVRAPA